MEIEYEVVNGCWICTSHACTNDGYPVATVNSVRDRIHRHYYRKYKGEIPKGMVVRHTCDNPGCINPDHLLLGTHADNVMDKVKRNRGATGTKNGRSKLTESDVISIYLDDDTPKETLAKEHGVDAKAIRDIKNRVTWKRTTTHVYRDESIDRFRINQKIIDTCICCENFGHGIDEFPCNKCTRNPENQPNSDSET